MACLSSLCMAFCALVDTSSPGIAASALASKAILLASLSVVQMQRQGVPADIHKQAVHLIVLPLRIGICEGWVGVATTAVKWEYRKTCLKKAGQCRSPLICQMNLTANGMTVPAMVQVWSLVHKRVFRLVNDDAVGATAVPLK